MRPGPFQGSASSQMLGSIALVVSVRALSVLRADDCLA